MINVNKKKKSFLIELSNTLNSSEVYLYASLSRLEKLSYYNYYRKYKSRCFSKGIEFKPIPPSEYANNNCLTSFDYIAQKLNLTKPQVIYAYHSGMKKLKTFLEQKMI